MRLFRRNCLRRCGGIFIFLGILLLLPWYLEAVAATPHFSYRLDVWQSDHGLPHDSVQAVVQTRDGYLWIGTRRGLARFDGMRFTILEAAPTRENISSLWEDRSGNLWIGTAKGIVRLNGGTIRDYGVADGAMEDDVRTIYEDKEGSIWFGRAGGLSQLKDGKFRHYSRNEGLPHLVVRSLCEDDQGNLWIATDGGLCWMKDGIISVPEMASAVGKAVRIVYFQPDGAMWVGTQTGLFRRNGDGWDHFTKMKDGLSDDFVDAFHYDRHGQLWIGTYGGLNRLENGTFHTELTSEGAAYDLVNCIMEDREGNSWIGSKEGLTRMKRKAFTAITKQQGLTYNNVMSVLEDKTGTFWCGTWGGGLFQVKDDKATGIDITNRLSNNRILSLCDARDGSLWFGTDHGDGLYRLKEGALSHYGESDGLDPIGIPVLCEDREGTLWIGTSRSLARFREGKVVHYTTKNGLAGDWIKALLEDKAGDLWIGTTKGLSRQKNGTFANFTTKDGLSENAILALYEDNENNLWIGTAGGGLCRMRTQDAMNPPAPRITSYSTKQGLCNDDVLEILEDDYGHLWMSCLKGIFRVSKKSLDQFDRKEIGSIPCTSYGKDDGMVSIICGNVAKPAGWKGRDGRLWFPTTKGLVIADPSIKLNGHVPPVIIEEVIADKKIVTSNEWRVREKTVERPNNHSSSVTIPAGRGELEFHYTALSFQAPERNRFRYKLEGVDPDWVDAGTRRAAYYNNIAPGHYTFRVIACNNDGVWNSIGAGTEFILLPHFRQTKWFIGLIGLASVGFVAGSVRYITWKKVQRKLDRLEQQHAIEKERTRIAQDMHDDLGARLTEILLLNTRAQKSSTKEEQVEAQAAIAEATEDIAQNLDAIVWAVSPRNDSLDKTILYLCDYLEKYLGRSAIRCRLDLDDKSPDIPVSSEARHNLFLTIKEAANNIVKHSGASEVWFRVCFDGSGLAASIEDNGRGFSSANVSDFGNGLINMRERVQKTGGQFEIRSEPGKGTRLQIRIPL